MRPKHRRVSRIIVIDETGHVLLLLTQSPKTRNRGPRWLTPGGGVEDHETHVQGAIRELFEETGLVVDDLEGPIHTLNTTVELADGAVQSSYAEFFLHRSQRFEIDRTNWLDYEHEDIHEVRWCSIEELIAGEQPYAPGNLVELIEQVLYP